MIWAVALPQLVFWFPIYVSDGYAQYGHNAYYLAVWWIRCSIHWCTLPLLLLLAARILWMMCSLGWALEHKGGHGRGIVAIGLLVFCKEGRKWFAWTFSNLFADVLKIDLWCLNTVAEYATALILMTWEVSPFEETKVKAGKEGPMNAVCGLSS